MSEREAKGLRQRHQAGELGTVRPTEGASVTVLPVNRLNGCDGLPSSAMQSGTTSTVTEPSVPAA